VVPASEVGRVDTDGVGRPAPEVGVDHVAEGSQVLVEEGAVVDDREVGASSVDLLCVP
jgi:hypothetical protein